MLVLWGGAVACRDRAAGGGQVRATVARPQMDTVAFAAPATRRRCAAGRGFLLEADADGNGLLVWLRPADSLGGEYQVLGVRDTVTPRGAIVAARYMTGDVAHGFSLDSGDVTVSDSGAVVRVRGAGLETPGALRPFLAADFVGLLPPSDSTPCEPQP